MSSLWTTSPEVFTLLLGGTRLTRKISGLSGGRRILWTPQPRCPRPTTISRLADHSAVGCSWHQIQNNHFVGGAQSLLPFQCKARHRIETGSCGMTDGSPEVLLLGTPPREAYKYSPSLAYFCVPTFTSQLKVSSHFLPPILAPSQQDVPLRFFRVGRRRLCLCCAVAWTPRCHWCVTYRSMLRTC